MSEKLGTSEILGMPSIKRDPQNLNIGSDRGRELIKQSIDKDGFARPVFAAADMTILGGNHAVKTVEELAASGKEFAEPLIVHTTGDRLVVHVRDDIPTAHDPRAVRLKILDNKTSEENYLPDVPAMVELLDEFQILPEDVGYTQEELVVVPSDSTTAGGFGAGAGAVGETYLVVIPCQSESHQRETYEQLKELGIDCELRTL